MQPIYFFRDGDCYADKLAMHGRSIPGVSWFSSFPHFLFQDFYRDINGLPIYCFP